MSRKHFVAIAATIADLSLSADDRRHVAERFASMLTGEACGRFDRARFLAACEPKPAAGHRESRA